MAPTATERPALPSPLKRDSLWTFGLLGLSAVLYMFGLPLSLLVIATGPAAMAFAISGLVNSRGVPAASAIRLWLGVSIAVGLMVMLTGLGLLLMRGPTEQLERCLDRAITESAKRECKVEYEKAYEDLLERYATYGRTT